MSLITHLYGLVGYPLSHSFSGKYFAEKFAAQGLHHCAYNLFELNNITNLANVLAQNPNLCGFNVSIPYKQAILSYLNQISAQAKQIGAVNVVAVVNNNQQRQLNGYNTDADGFKQALLPFLKPSRYPARALILGTGGSMLAVKFALQSLGIAVSFATRSLKNSHSPNNTFLYTQLTPDIVAKHLLIVNTTPLGMHPHLQTCPNIPYHALTPKHICFDLVYNPAQTVFYIRRKKWGQPLVTVYLCCKTKPS